jgi:hypothetical protein
VVSTKNHINKPQTTKNKEKTFLKQPKPTVYTLTKPHKRAYNKCE